MALAARIAPPQGVAFHTSTDAAPAERGAKHCNVFLRFRNEMWVHAKGLSPATVAKCRTAVMLHGIMGTGRNWMSPALKIVERNPGWRILLTDLRGHGAAASAGAAGEPHTLDACARDVRRTVAEAIGDASHDGVPEVVIGHSFGGKVALSLAASALEDGLTPPRDVWVMDSLPGPFPASSFAPDAYDAAEAQRTQSTEFVLRAAQRVAALPHFDRRADIVAALEGEGVGKAAAMWLASATQKVEKKLTLAHNFDTVRELYNAYGRTDLWALLEDATPGVSELRINAVVAGRAAWRESDLARLHAGCDWSTTLEESGHNVHVDDLEGTLAALQRSFD